MLLVEVEEQEVATIPGRNLGCRHEDIVELRKPGRTGVGGMDAAVQPQTEKCIVFDFPVPTPLVS